MRASEIDKKKLAELAYTPLKTRTIATLLGCEESQIRKSKVLFRIVEEKRAEFKRDLLQSQIEMAQSKLAGATTMRIWLGKQYLEQTDKQVVRQTGVIGVGISAVERKRLKAVAKAVAESVEDEEEKPAGPGKVASIRERAGPGEGKGKGGTRASRRGTGGGGRV